MPSSRRDTIRGIVLVNIATCAWATNIILGRYLRGQIGPLTLTAARYGVASVVFALLLRGKPVADRRVGTDLRILTLMALTGIVLFAPALYFGLRFTTAINGTLINSVSPLLTAVFAAWLIREPFSAGQVAGALAALGGVAVLLTGGRLPSGGALSPNPGDLLILFAATAWSLYSVAVVETASSPAAWSPALIGIILYLGVVPAALGFLCWNAGVKRLGAGGAMVFYNTLPLYGALFGFLFLGETLGPAHLAGGALILAGGLVSAMTGKKKRQETV
jgi:drug/metabolite transporter (DMT)-like permease